MRGRALRQADLPGSGAAAGARLPLPLLDVRPGPGREGALRAGRPAASSAAALRGPGRRAPGRRELLRPGRARVVGRAQPEAVVIRRPVRFLDERTGSAPFLRKALRYVFPDHWSFLLGEVALYAFIVLVGTGIYLTLFFDPSTATTTYHGEYRPLHGFEMTQAYRSVVDISFKVKAGLLMRQTHHWAADVFVVAIVLHLLRIFFTGAFRKPRELTYYLGLSMLGPALLEGYLRHSLADDLLSGMGLAIGYSVLMSVPVVGANLAELVWGGPFPGTPAFWSRMYVAHVFLFPMLIATLLGAHLLLVAARHHTQFRGPRKTARKAVGVTSFPGRTQRSLRVMLAATAGQSLSVAGE